MSLYPDHNPRYVAYAAAHGRAPDDQLVHDHRVWSGGCMVGFMLWIAEQRRAFKAAHPEHFLHDGIVDQDAWTEWLQAVRS
jgi:hypothetical protein